jgi:hypothetical protein
MTPEELDILDKVVVPLAVALIGIAATAFFAVVGALRDRLQQAATVRRDRYAEISKTLTAWCEMPYRVRRRTSDDPEVLAALADRAHDLQERLASHRAWVKTENGRAARVFDETLKTISAKVGPAMNDAWTRPKVNEPKDMNLEGWGPAGCQADLDRFESEVCWRFGFRRLVGPVRRAWLNIGE